MMLNQPKSSQPSQLPHQGLDEFDDMELIPVEPIMVREQMLEALKEERADRRTRIVFYAFLGASIVFLTWVIMRVLTS